MSKIKDVERLIKSQSNDLNLETITSIAEGGESDTYEVNGAFIFRFARDEYHSLKLMREVKILNIVGNSLPIAVPYYQYVGIPSNDNRFYFLGHRKIEGISGEKRRPLKENRASIAQSLGAFLSTLHSASTCGLNNIEIPETDIEDPKLLLQKAVSCQSIIKRHFAEKDKTISLDLDEVVRYLREDIPLPSPSNLPYVLSHADFKGEHLLLNSEATEIEGIIDWSDLCMTDAIVDFQGLLIWLGKDFVERILDNYTLPMDNQFLDRIVFYARCHTLINLGERLAGESEAPLNLLETQLKWAFS